MQRGRVPQERLARLRVLCLELPAVYEEAAWAGTRWMIGKRNFTHAVMIERGRPPPTRARPPRRGRWRW